MKKILSILLIIIYSTATFGMPVKEFYCCGKLKSVSVSFTIFSNGSKQIKDDGCCKTKYHLSKVKDNHIAAAKIKPDAKKSIEVPVSFNTSAAVAFIKRKISLSNDIHSPPILYDGVPVYILHCNYRI